MAEAGARIEDRGLRLVAGSEGGPEDLVGEYLATLGDRSASTMDAYGRVLRSLSGWVAERPGGAGGFRPELLTRTAVESYLKELEGRGYSVSHRSRAKSVASGFAGWLIEENASIHPARLSLPRCFIYPAFLVATSQTLPRLNVPSIGEVPVQGGPPHPKQRTDLLHRAFALVL